MANIPAILIAASALSFFFYMTGYKGAIVLAVLLIMLMGAVYFKQNALLYMPGKSMWWCSCARPSPIQC